MEKFGEERISQILGKSSSIHYIYDTLIDHLTLTILDSKKKPSPYFNHQSNPSVSLVRATEKRTLSLVACGMDQK